MTLFLFISPHKALRACHQRRDHRPGDALCQPGAPWPSVSVFVSVFVTVSVFVADNIPPLLVTVVICLSLLQIIFHPSYICDTLLFLSSLYFSTKVMSFFFFLIFFISLHDFPLFSFFIMLFFMIMFIFSQNDKFSFFISPRTAGWSPTPGSQTWWRAVSTWSTWTLCTCLCLCCR